MGMHKITLNVDSDTLWNLPNPDRSQIESACSLHLKNKNFAGAKAKTDELDVTSNGKVRWQGESLAVGETGFVPPTFPDVNLDYDISIDCIMFQFQGDNYFDQVVLLGKGGKTNKKVTASIKNLSSDCDAYWYTIVFTIWKDDESKSFYLDPKLRIK